MGTLQVLCVDYDAPYVYQKDGEPSGMIVSILNDFAETAGLSLNYTSCADRSAAAAPLEQGQYDILIGMPMTSGTCSELGFINSAPIMESALCYVQNPTAAKEDGGTIAIVRGLDDLISSSAYENTLLFDSASECLKAVESKKVDLAVGNRSVMEYYIYDTGSTLVSSLLPGQMQNVSVAVSRECDETLLSILNSYIYSISESNLAAYLSSGNLHSDSFSPHSLHAPPSRAGYDVRHRRDGHHRGDHLHPAEPLGQAARHHAGAAQQAASRGASGRARGQRVENDVPLQYVARYPNAHERGHRLFDLACQGA